MVWLIIAAAALALGAGLCASAEVALMRVSRSGAGELARNRKGNRNRAATRLQAVLAEPARYLAVLLLARVCSETAAIVLVAAALLHWLRHRLARVPAGFCHHGRRALRPGRDRPEDPRPAARAHRGPGGGRRAVPRDPGPRAPPAAAAGPGQRADPGPGIPGRVRHRGRAARPGRPAGTAPGHRARGAGHDPLGVRARGHDRPRGDGPAHRHGLRGAGQDAAPGALARPAQRLLPDPGRWREPG